MAKTTLVMLTCDLHRDTAEAVATLRIDNGGRRFELDVCQAHLDELTASGRSLSRRRRTKSAAAKKRAPARKRTARASKATRPASRARRTHSSRDSAAVREWAKANGHAIKDRGRIPASVLEAYAASS
jgi:hypothetical protein